MAQKAKNIFLISFIATILYTGHGILQLGKQGGPCNAGLAILVLTPFLILCIVLLAMTFPWLTFSNKTNFFKPIFFSITSLIIWTYWFYVFADDGVADSLLYLGLFELLNIFILSFFIRQAVRNNKDNQQSHD